MLALSASFRSQLLTILTGNGAVAIANFLGFVYLARQLGPLNVGAYASAVVLVDVVMAFVNFGFNQAVIRHRGNSEIYGAAVTAVLAQSVVVLLVGIGLSILSFQKQLPGVEPAWLPLAVAIFRVIGLYTTLLYAEHEVKLDYGIISRGQVAAALIANASAIAAAFAAAGVLALLVRDCAAALVMLVTFWRHRRRGLGPTLSRGALSQLFNFSSRVWVLNGLEVLCGRTDSLIVSRLLGPVAMGGYYSLRSLCDGVSGFLVKPIQTLLFAKYCRLDETRALRSLTAKLALPYLALLIAFCLALNGVADSLVRIVLGPKFDNFGASLPWLVLAAGCVIWYENVKVLGMASGVLRPAMLARSLQILVIAGTSAVLVPKYHAVGAAMAFSLGAVTLAFVATSALARATSRLNKG